MENQEISFEQIVNRGCGIDVHKKTIVATIRGTGIREVTKSYDSFTSSIESMRDWLKSNKITHVVMESTGVYCKPILMCLQPIIKGINLKSLRKCKK